MTRSLSKKITLGLFLGWVFSVSAFFGQPVQTAAQTAKATFLVSPTKGTYQVGDKLSVSVYINSGGGAGINAAESTVTFTDNLSVLSVNQSGSIFELWTTKPAFSNKNGTITFGGGMTSAYTGASGKVFTISFSTLKAGSAKVAFGGSVITAADGMGTNVYGGSNFATYTISDKQVAKPVETPKVDNAVKPGDSTGLEQKPTETAKANTGMLPPAPEVSSQTHTNPEQWYSQADAKFEWKNLSSVTGVSLIITQSSSSDPGTKSDGIIQSKEYKDLANGTHYFHIKLQNKDGWGPITHRKVLVDTESPIKPELTIDSGGDSTNPTPLLKIYTNDRISGLDKLKISLNSSNKELQPRDFLVEPYQLDKLLPGAYSVALMVYDKAGNTSSSSLDFIVDPLRAPTITEIPRELNVGDGLTIRGASFYPKSMVSLSIASGEADPQVFQVKTDENGNWNYFHVGRLEEGGYRIWAKVIDERGAESLESPKQFLTISSPGVIASYGVYIILSLIFIIIMEFFYILYLKKSFRRDMGRIQAETGGAQKRVGDIFLALNEEVDELVELADKRPGLSESERRVKEKMKEALNISEEFLNKEIEDIEKEIVVTKRKKKK